MCRRGKTWLIGLLAVTASFVGTVSATCYLPDGLPDDCIWPRSVTCEGHGFKSVTDFALYDVGNMPFSYDVPIFEQSTTSCPYIDAYQILNRQKSIFGEGGRFSDVLIIDVQQNGCAVSKGGAGCCGCWSCGEILIPQRSNGRRAAERTFNRSHLCGDGYLHFPALR